MIRVAFLKRAGEGEWPPSGGAEGRQRPAEGQRGHAEVRRKACGLPPPAAGVRGGMQRGGEGRHKVCGRTVRGRQREGRGRREGQSGHAGGKRHEGMQRAGEA